eukprot:CAMPEP_0182451946 /NCGR_PEP_ID=MMETSP1172-20130603/43989_1 /TAXON_ID=708627 /ORGANISM="Timspurckia oligopyrenoides, Strain CCMP3278" /LENGTH=235 /DNA_ID=CAMNT_0024649753 /DNA_START=3228 /DNA_END=3935 /DNA_ORIENTATION=-
MTFSFPAPGFAAVRKSKEEILQELKERSEKSPEQLEEERIAREEEKRKRLEKQREIQRLAAEKQANGEEKQIDIDANLRANYYYPTARKRYLPRIKVANDSMDDLKLAIEEKRWSDATGLLKGPIADATGPLKLYASALTGQGLSLSVSYVKDMTECGEKYEKNVAKLEKALSKKNSSSASELVKELDSALQKYRIAARINTEDGGVGAIPTDKRLGSGFSNNNPTLYRKNIGTL